MNNQKAFTLVELIVVVTILAILATIGFVSYSSYLTGVRDTNRIAQMTSLSDGLNLYSTRNDLPIPEDNVEVLVNGSLIAYQGYAGANILETINFEKGGVDPKDNTYFSYYLTRDKKYFQLMGFLEESADFIAVGNNILLNKTQAINYEARIPIVFGKKLGILTDTSNTPIQELQTIVTNRNLDIYTSTDDYSAHFSDILSLTGNGASFTSMIAINNPLFSKFDPSLAVYFNFDRFSLNDGSKNSLKAKKTGGSDTEDIKGEFAAYISGGGGNHFIVPNATELSSGLSDFTMSAWTKLDADLLSGAPNTEYHIMGNEEYQDMGFLARIEHRATPSDSGRLYFRTNGGGSVYRTMSSGGEYPNDRKWHHVAFVKSGTVGTIYIDGEEVSGYQVTETMQNPVASTYDFAIGSHRAGGSITNFLGYLDDIRVYNRAINIEEIETLYKVDKKVD